MTGDLVRAMRSCPQPIIAAVEGVCAGAGAILAMASDIRFGQPGCQDRLPVQPRRPVGRRHGRLRDPAADHRPRPRRRTALHRPRHDQRRRPRLGLLQPRRRGRAGRGSCARRTSSPSGPSIAHCGHQTPARRRVEHDRSTRRSKPKRGHRRGAWRPTTSTAPMKRSRTSASRSSRVTRPFVTREAGSSPQKPISRFRGNDELDVGQILPLLALLRAAPRARRRLQNGARTISPAATPTISTANAGRWFASSARRVSSSSASPTATVAPTCAASPSRAKRSPITARSPTSPSRCRASARARSACSGRSSRSANGCRESQRAKRSPPSP